MSTSVQIITLELNAIVGALTLANNTLKRVQGQMPPGPPAVPEQLTALKVISDLSTQIQTLSAAIQAGPVGTPGTPP
jgi:hypothetical protein